MAQETLISVPLAHVSWVSAMLSQAGVTVLDTGERVTTEDDLNGEAVLCLATLSDTEVGEASIHHPPIGR